MTLARKALAEGVGTAALLCAVIGSGIMAEQLAGGNSAIALLANTLATVFALYVLIETLGPVSGAHFNPVVTLAMVFRRALPAREAGLLFVILRAPAGKAAALVACYIGAAYWFTASTSFANPAAVLGRTLSDSFAGIAPASAPGFVLAQCAGAAAGVVLATLLTPRQTS